MNLAQINEMMRGAGVPTVPDFRSVGGGRRSRGVMGSIMNRLPNVNVGRTPNRGLYVPGLNHPKSVHKKRRKRSRYNDPLDREIDMAETNNHIDRLRNVRRKIGLRKSRIPKDSKDELALAKKRQEEFDAQQFAGYIRVYC